MYTFVFDSSQILTCYCVEEIVAYSWQWLRQSFLNFCVVFRQHRELNFHFLQTMHGAYPLKFYPKDTNASMPVLPGVKRCNSVYNLGTFCVVHMLRNS